MSIDVFRRLKLLRHNPGAFAHDWMKEAGNGRERFQRLDAEAREHPIEQVGARLRDMMPWLSESRLVDKTTN